MASSAILAGLGLATMGYAGRYVIRNLPAAGKKLENVVKSIETSGSWANARYHKGGFEPGMSKREAALILGISPNAPPKRIKDAHKRIMLLNHPDKGGSPYLAAKINEAKDFFDK